MTDQMLSADEQLRKAAVARLAKKREFGGHLLAYVAFNGFLVTIWAMTGANFFWPIFPIVLWGIGLVFHAWDVYGREPSEDRIQAEMERIQRRRTG